MSAEPGKPTLFVKFAAREGCFEELLARMRPLIDVARDDPGVEVYRMHATVERSAIWFYEQYADAAAGQAHREDPRLRTVLDACNDLLDGREVVAGTLLGEA
ncbi:MAG: Antibiotic biosynthesis monooxygenase [Baekduia sp.]|jgi:quinol monooxygenase YgiN|nr:Antibiotic biosynthesis monooxygenase [Conexibacter sp.]MDX6717565.1 Antibiotic biosynthesis monooxygenase [Baekduia sp.]